MPIQTVPVTVEIPKEAKEVVDAVAAIIDAIVQKKPIAEFAALLPVVLTAVDGVNALGEEAKSVYNDELAGYALQKIMGAIKGPQGIPL